jgi:predicted nucleotidyltransferase
MAAKLHPIVAAMRKCRNAAGLVRPSAIRRLAQQIAEKFHPDKIILFGSYAYGTPDEGSDVDILVVMPAKNTASQASRIRDATAHPFPLDLLVRDPKELQRELDEENWFLREVVSQGKVLYEKANKRLGSQSRNRHGRREAIYRRQA